VRWRNGVRMAPELLDQILHRLGAIRASLRSGSFAALEDHAATLADLADRAERAGADAASLAAIGAAARRNAALLDSTMQGLRSARRRLHEIEAAGTGLRVYDNRGRGDIIAARPGLTGPRV